MRVDGELGRDVAAVATHDAIHDDQSAQLADGQLLLRHEGRDLRHVDVSVEPRAAVRALPGAQIERAAADHHVAGRQVEAPGVGHLHLHLERDVLAVERCVDVGGAAVDLAGREGVDLRVQLAGRGRVAERDVAVHRQHAAADDVGLARDDGYAVQIDRGSVELDAHDVRVARDVGVERLAETRDDAALDAHAAAADLHAVRAGAERVAGLDHVDLRVANDGDPAGVEHDLAANVGGADLLLARGEPAGVDTDIDDGTVHRPGGGRDDRDVVDSVRSVGDPAADRMRARLERLRAEIGLALGRDDRVALHRRAHLRQAREVGDVGGEAAVDNLVVPDGREVRFEVGGGPGICDVADGMRGGLRKIGVHVDDGQALACHLAGQGVELHLSLDLAALGDGEVGVRVKAHVGDGRLRNDGVRVDVTNADLRIDLGAVADVDVRVDVGRALAEREVRLRGDLRQLAVRLGVERDLLLDADLAERGAHPLAGRVVAVEDGVDLGTIHVGLERGGNAGDRPVERGLDAHGLASSRRHVQMRADATLGVDAARQTARDELDATDVCLGELRIVVRVRLEIVEVGIDRRSARRLAVNPRMLQDDARCVDADATRIRILRLGRRGRALGEGVRDAHVAGGIAVDGRVDVVERHRIDRDEDVPVAEQERTRRLDGADAHARTVDVEDLPPRRILHANTNTIDAVESEAADALDGDVTGELIVEDPVHLRRDQTTCRRGIEVHDRSCSGRRDDCGGGPDHRSDDPQDSTCAAFFRAAFQRCGHQ